MTPDHEGVLQQGVTNRKAPRRAMYDLGNCRVAREIAGDYGSGLDSTILEMADDGRPLNRGPRTDSHRKRHP